MLRKKPDKTLPPTSIWPAIRLDSQSLTEHPMAWSRWRYPPAALGTRSWTSPPPGWWGAWSYLTPLGSLVKLLIPLAMRVTMLTSRDWLFGGIRFVMTDSRGEKSERPSSYAASPVMSTPSTCPRRTWGGAAWARSAPTRSTKPHGRASNWHTLPMSWALPGTTSTHHPSFHTNHVEHIIRMDKTGNIKDRIILMQAWKIFILKKQEQIWSNKLGP